MAYGRIKHSRTKRDRAARQGKLALVRGVNVHVRVARNVRRLTGRVHYTAHACIKGHISGSRSCGRFKIARTPQSAVAKALKSLSSVVAKRGRR